MSGLLSEASSTSKKRHLQCLLLYDFEVAVESGYEKPQALSLQSWYILVVLLVCVLLCAQVELMTFLLLQR